MSGKAQAAVEQEPAVRTVKGPIPASRLGVTLTHEHLMVDLRCNWRPSDDPGAAFLPVAAERSGRIRANPFAARDNLMINDPPAAADELLLFRDAGGATVVDATPPGLGRDPRALEWLSDRTGVNVVAGCGYYIEAAHPPGMEGRPVEELAAEMIRDITEGMDGGALKAGVIGEIGVTASPMRPSERRVLQAAALAQQATGCAVVAHSAAAAESPFEVLEVLAAAGADLSRVIQSHLDDRFRTDLDKFRRAAEMGANFGLDTFGRELYYRSRRRRHPSDDTRVETVLLLLEAGLIDHILPSQDICFKHELSKYGGHGYSHFLRRIVPRLRRRGVSDSEIDQMLRVNPARVLAAPAVSG